MDSCINSKYVRTVFIKHEGRYKHAHCTAASARFRTEALIQTQLRTRSRGRTSMVRNHRYQDACRQMMGSWNMFFAFQHAYAAEMSPHGAWASLADPRVPKYSSAGWCSPAVDDLISRAKRETYAGICLMNGREGDMESGAVSTWGSFEPDMSTKELHVSASVKLIQSVDVPWHLYS